MLLCLQWVQYRKTNPPVLIHFSKWKTSFNAALPAMGLVSATIPISIACSIVKFQCCFACNGFSIQSSVCVQSSGVAVSMLLCLQWVQYASVTEQYQLSNEFQCCFACNGFSIIGGPDLDLGNRNCFNAALPAMGLVYTAVFVLRSCKVRFNAALPAMGLVF